MIDKNLGQVIPFSLSPVQMRRGAEGYRRRGQPVEAAELLRRAAEQDDSPIGWLHLAEQWRRMGCYEQAEGLLSRLLAREDPIPETWMELARCQQALGRGDSAADSLYHYLDEEPYSAESDTARSMLALLENGDAEREAFRLPLLIRRGLNAWRAGQRELGLFRLDRAAFMACRPARLYVTLALLLLADNRCHEAITALAAALRAEPGHVRASCMLCVALAAAGKKRAARGFLRGCMALCASPEGEEPFLTAAWTLSAWDETEEYLTARLKKQPARIALMRPMAELQWFRGDAEQARQWWRQILRVDSDDIQARALLAWSETHAGEELPPAGALPAEAARTMLESLAHAAAVNQPACELLRRGSDTHAALRWCLSLPRQDMQAAAAALLLREDAPEARRMVREQLITPGLLPETQQRFLLWLAARGDAAPVNVLVGQRIASASCTREGPRRSTWRMFLPQLLREASRGYPKGALAAFAAGLWPQLTPAQRRQAAGPDGYAWARAIEILYLQKTGREALAAGSAAELLISVRKICRILRAIIRRTDVRLPLKGE